MLKIQPGVCGPNLPALQGLAARLPMEETPLLTPCCTPHPTSPPGLAGASSATVLQDQLAPCPEHVWPSWLYTQGMAQETLILVEQPWPSPQVPFL